MLSFRSNIALILVLTLGKLSAQLIPVQDEVMRQYLCSKFPLAMNAECSLLDTIKAGSQYPSIAKISLINKGIISADEIIYFSNLDTLYLSQNKLTSFPEDISNFRSLDRLALANNLLTSAPNIHYINKVSGDTAVKLVYLQYNKLNSLPPSWYTYNDKTQVVDLYNNELTTIPTFNNYPQIRRLDVRENYLGFESLIPLKSAPTYDIYQFDLFPQKPFPLAVDSVVELGDTVLIDVSTSLNSNEYTLLKNDRNYETNRTGKFTIVINTFMDTAAYWVKIRNDSFPDQSDFLKTEVLKLQFKETPKEEFSEGGNIQVKDIFVFSPDGDGVADSFKIEGEGEVIFYNKAGQEIRTENLPFEWFGKDKNGNRVVPGLYLVKKPKGDFLKVMIAY